MTTQEQKGNKSETSLANQTIDAIGARNQSIEQPREGWLRLVYRPSSEYPTMRAFLKGASEALRAQEGK